MNYILVIKCEEMLSNLDTIEWFHAPSNQRACWSTTSKFRQVVQSIIHVKSFHSFLTLWLYKRTFMKRVDSITIWHCKSKLWLQTSTKLVVTSWQKYVISIHNSLPIQCWFYNDGKYKEQVNNSDVMAQKTYMEISDYLNLNSHLI